MAEDRPQRVFIPDPPPAGMDPRIADWITRQLLRINSLTYVVEETQDGQDQDLADHEADIGNPHHVRHEQLTDVAFPTILENPHGMMRWRGPWVSQDYHQHDVVLDGDWTMVANKDTSDRAAPYPIGLPGYVYAGASPTTTTSAKELAVAQRFTSPIPGYIQGYRVYTVPDSTYRVFAVINPGPSEIINSIISFTGSSTGWVAFTISPVPLNVGRVFELWVAIAEPAITPVTWTADWRYTTPNNTANPASGDAVHANKNLDELRINKTDDNGGDQSANLLSLTPGDTISVQTITWTIQAAPSDQGTYVSFAIAPAQQAPSDGVYTFTFETVATAPLETVVDTNYYQSNPNVSGFISVDGATPAPTEDAYGIDVLVQEASVSPDWDLVAYSGD